MLKKTLESPLECKKIKPVNPKGNQYFLNIYQKEWCWSSNTLAPWYKELTHWKRPWCWERLKAGEGEGDRGWDGWMVSPTQWTESEQTLGESEGQESLACCSPWGRKELDTTEWLNNKKLLQTMLPPEPFSIAFYPNGHPGTGLRYIHQLTCQRYSGGFAIIIWRTKKERIQDPWQFSV